MTPAEVAALVRRYRQGDRVRATCPISYAFTRGLPDVPEDIDEGAEGSVERQGPAGVVAVVWDGFARSVATSPGNLEPVTSKAGAT